MLGLFSKLIRLVKQLDRVGRARPHSRFSVESSDAGIKLEHASRIGCANLLRAGGENVSHLLGQDSLGDIALHDRLDAG